MLGPTTASPAATTRIALISSAGATSLRRRHPAGRSRIILGDDHEFRLVAVVTGCDTAYGPTGANERIG